MTANILTSDALTTDALFATLDTIAPVTNRYVTRNGRVRPNSNTTDLDRLVAEFNTATGYTLDPNTGTLRGTNAATLDPVRLSGWVYDAALAAWR